MRDEPSIDLSGKTFGRLSVVEWAVDDPRPGVHWKCRCECGNDTVVVGSNLRNGNTTSCGKCGRGALSEELCALVATAEHPWQVRATRLLGTLVGMVSVLKMELRVRHGDNSGLHRMIDE